MTLLKMSGTLLLSVLLFTVSHAQDWPNLTRYRQANEQLGALPVPKDRVVFLGNSITDAWIENSPGFFEDNHFLDRGISGQTSPQMLVRFRQDVVDLKPRKVVLLCGINDIAGNTGPSTLEMIEDNIMSMAQIAKANKIKMVLCSVLPAYAFPWKPEVHPVDSITALNDWIKKYARKKHLKYVDYYSAMVDDRKGLRAEYTTDGVHPNKLGYSVMEGVVRKVL